MHRPLDTDTLETKEWLDALEGVLAVEGPERAHYLLEQLVNKARRHLQSLKIRNVRLAHGDGSADLGEAIAVDAIIVAAGATHVPTSLLRYLKPGGRMVLPLASNDEGERGLQRLTVIEAAPTGIREQTFDTVRFVPLLAGLG